MKKTNKAVLSKHLESKVLPVEEVPHPSATVIDAMGLMNKLHGENRTFTELSDHVFSQMLHAGHGSDRIHVVFDVHHSDTINSAVRVLRGSTEGIAFSNIMPGHKINNWMQLISCTESKNDSFSRKAGRDRRFEKSSDESACLSLLVIGASSLLKAVGKKSMTFNLHKKRPTHVSCYMSNMLQKPSQR